MASPQPRFWMTATGYGLPMLLLVALAIAHWHQAGGPRFAVDDAYITQHNAWALLHGSDPVFIDAAPLDGATSAVHLALVALGGLALPLDVAQFLAGVLCALAYAAGLVRLARVMSAPLWSASAFAALMLVVGDTPHQLLNGLETALALALETWLLIAWATPAWHRRVLPVLAGLLPFVRPEFAALSALSLVAAALQHEGARAMTLVRMAGVSALTAAPWALWYWSSTGVPWPSTVMAKRYYFAEWCAPWATRWQIFWPELLRFTGIVGAAVFGLVFLFRQRLARAALLFVALMLGAYLTQFPSAISHYEHRYLYVLLPLMGWGLASSLWGASKPWRRAALAVAVVGALQATWSAPTRLAQHFDAVRSMQRNTGDVAKWLRANLAPGTRVMIHDAGLLSIDSPFQLVDLVGLKTPSAIAVHREAGFAVCGHGQQGIAAGVIAFNQHATVLVMLDLWDQIFQLGAGLQHLGFTLTRLDGERGDSIYRVYQLTPPAQLPHN